MLHPDWSYRSVLYEMNVRQLTHEGTLRAAASRLAFLRDLGVDVVWLMPVHPIGAEGRKGSLGSYYSIRDYCAVNPELGSMEDFDAFVSEAHRLGMKAVADGAAQEADAESILHVYRTFGALRNTYPALAMGAMTEHLVYNADNTQYRQIAAWYRTEGDQRMLVLHNFSSSSVSLPLTDAVDKAVATLNSVSGSFGDASSVRLGGYASVVLLLK